MELNLYLRQKVIDYSTSIISVSFVSSQVYSAILTLSLLKRKEASTSRMQLLTQNLMWVGERQAALRASENNKAGKVR